MGSLNPWEWLREAFRWALGAQICPRCRRRALWLFAEHPTDPQAIPTVHWFTCSECGLSNRPPGFVGAGEPRPEDDARPNPRDRPAA